MDKVSRKPGTKYTHELMIDKLDEIVDWFNARERVLNWEPPTVSNKPSIEQELESGLVYGNNGHWYVIDGDRAKGAPIKKDPCTRIFLPAAKYEEWHKSQKPLIGSDVRLAVFHDVPVFSYSGDKTIFCTD